MPLEFHFLDKTDIPSFKRDVRDVFGQTHTAEFGPDHGKDAGLAEYLDKSLQDPLSQTFFIFDGVEKVGGISLHVNEETQHNSVEFLYIYPGLQGRGLGQRIWKGIESRYPDTKIWELATPYYDKRNIHFYVNRCGFHIVEFFNKYHRGSDASQSNDEFDDTDLFFRFEKKMSQG